MRQPGRSKVSIAEALGLHPFARQLDGIRRVLGGDPSVPAMRVGVSGLRLLSPRLALPLWLGKTPVPRRAVITNLFNRTQTPAALGWSVRRTRVRDFRGGRLTYDSHNGTDFAVPPGSVVAAPAPGRVALVLFEFNRGGLKLLIDHGGGWFTSHHHLSRALCGPGTAVGRGTPVALSGMSGIDGVTFFPWLAPHLHVNVLSGASVVDPFGAPGETSLWRRRNAPSPTGEDSAEPVPAPSVFIEDRVNAALAACRSERRRFELARLPGGLLGPALLVDVTTYPTRYPRVAPDLVETSPRRPFLDLPLARASFDGVVYADELGRKN